MLPWNPQQAQHPQCAFSDVVYQRLRAMAAPAIALWVCGDLPGPTARSHTPAFQLSRGPGALPRPDGRELPETPPPLRADVSSKGVAGQVPSVPADQIPVASDHFPRGPAIPGGSCLRSRSWRAGRRDRARGGRRKVGVGAAEPGARKPGPLSAAHEYAGATALRP